MRNSIVTYIILAAVSFLILSIVQLYLIYNTYELKNERYYFEEKNLIKEAYRESITNDKLFPGGQQIIDSFIYRNMQRLEFLYKTNRQQFDLLKEKMVDSIALDLAEKESLCDFLCQYKKKKAIDDSLEYALMIESLDIRFADKPYVSIYSKNQKYKFIEEDMQEKNGLRIGGGLEQLNKQNEVTAITVSSPLPYTYRMSFSLHVEPVNRGKMILGQMGLIFGLSLLSVIIIVSLFFVTFRNWLRQRKLSEMKSDFINNITHEFHTPIAAIIVANKSLQNEKIVESRENIRPLTEVIQRQSDRLKILIGQVLDVVSVNKINLNKKEHSVHHLLEEILLDYRLNLADTNIKMSFNKQAVKDVADLDQFYFTTMLLNIFDNALKYNENEIKEITVTTLNEKNNLQIIITDNGIGMQEEVMKHIFDKFYRGKDYGDQKAKGLGLGLYYVKQCVDAHKWKIEVKSKPGEGSTFIITIPI